MQKTKDSTALVWFRNDLRTLDNIVLDEACKKNDKVIAVYCLDPRHFDISHFGFKKTEKFRAQFLLETLNDLKAQLLNLNIELLVYHKQPKAIIPELCDKYQINAIYLQKEWTREEVEVEQEVASKLNAVEIISLYNQFLYHPDDINFEIDKTPQVFTVFRKKLEKDIPVRKDLKIEKLPTSNRIDNTTEIPQLSDLGFDNFQTHPNSAFPFKAGETEGLTRLEVYFFKSKKLGVYKKTRNGLVGTDYSSKFSAWLANGSLSVRSIYWQVKRFEKEHFKNESTYWLIFELIWRDYFKYISLKHQNDIFKIGGILNKDYDWKTDKNLVSKWVHGETKSSFVNANMLELKKTGWMSNRGRQNVASFFAKDLLLDWRIGAAYFESMLLDYDVHSNYGNWIYVSGVGNDPRDRKFNVELQAERYDATAKFQNLWLQKTLF